MLPLNSLSRAGELYSFEELVGSKGRLSASRITVWHRGILLALALAGLSQADGGAIGISQVYCRVTASKF